MMMPVGSSFIMTGTDNRIEGHICVALMALCLHVTLKQRGRLPPVASAIFSGDRQADPAASDPQPRLQHLRRCRLGNASIGKSGSGTEPSGKVKVFAFSS